jgi:PTH1 family peptidyl-tRNA hydrolase
LEEGFLMIPFWKRGQPGRKPARLVVGLGNPDREYERTRHNLGFLTIDRLARDLGISVNKGKSRALIGETRIGNEQVILVKPQTYMNLSGLAVAPLASWYKVEPGNILVICDDLDLDLGQIRIRRQGGSGGHNGLKSIINSLQTEAFPRLRIGIGRPPGDWEAAGYVLQPLQGESFEALADIARLAADAVRCCLEQGLEAAMNRFNS